MADTAEVLTKLFFETGHAHHEAYIETDGYDPEWPLRYADYLMTRLPVLLGREFTKSELVYDIVFLSREQPKVAPDADWSAYYADYFINSYA
ncbi:MAG: hypothetical protein GY762_19395 [Proteobacteria bacterium]|nr:hypothetical protein [Pseudomonadota bacterium]